MAVQRVVGWYKLGLTPEEITDRSANLARAHAALAYNHASRGQLETDLAVEEAEGDQAE